MLVNILTNLLSVDFVLLSSVSDASKSTYFGRSGVKTRACTQLNYGPDLNPDMYSLGCDPVKFSQDLGRANLTLASTQNRRLFASKPTSALFSPKQIIYLESPDHPLQNDI